MGVWDLANPHLSIYKLNLIEI